MKSNFKSLTMVFTALAIIGTTTLVSSEKDATLTGKSSAQNDTAIAQANNVEINLNQNDRELFAKSLAKRFANESLSFSELNNAIHVVAGYGLDENLKFYDILNTDNSVFLLPSQQVNKLRSALEKGIDLSVYGLTENNYYGDLQFYWPYHDDWDKQTTPVICFAPEDKDAPSVTGYYYENGNLVSFTVTEKSIDEEHIPVIIINKSETNYGAYPNFKIGELEKNGTIWGSPMPSLPFNPTNDNSSSDNKVYDARSVSITSSGTQYDNIWYGGSEFELQSIYATDANSAQVSSKARAEFSRKQIRNHETKNFRTQLHENFQPGLGGLVLCLTEVNEGGGTTSVVINLNVAGSTLSTTINFNSKDKILYQGHFSRSIFFHDCYDLNGAFMLGTETVNCMLNIYDSIED